MFKTPILFLIFNRPNTTLKVFEVIRQIKPAELFIASDGPRNSKEGERERISKLRQQILELIDWDCKVFTLFRESNLGCGRAVSEAITWFFEEVEEGIILEDDTLPDLGFFSFCQSLLSVYRDTNEVAIISGTNYLFNKFESNTPYYFSSLTAIWGWATWKRTWEGFKQDSGLSTAIDYQIIAERFKNKHYSLHFYRMLQDALAARMDTWDLQFSYFLIKTNGLAIVPIYNQVKNIGYEGTHTDANHQSIFIDMPIKRLDLNNIGEKIELKVNEKFDRIALINIANGDNLAPSFMRRLINKVKSILQ